MHWFMCLAAMHASIGLAERADVAFDVLHESERHASLTTAGRPAYRAVLADFGERAIEFGRFHGTQWSQMFAPLTSEPAR